MDEMVSKFLYKCNQWWDIYYHIPTLFLGGYNVHSVTICLWSKNIETPNFPNCVDTCRISFFERNYGNVKSLTKESDFFSVYSFISRTSLVYLGCDDELVNYFSSKAKEFLVNKLSKQEEEIDLLPEYL